MGLNIFGSAFFSAYINILKFIHELVVLDEMQIGVFGSSSTLKYHAVDQHAYLTNTYFTDLMLTSPVLSFTELQAGNKLMM